MNWLKLKWKPIVASFIATLAILLVGNYLWLRTAVERPLIQVLLQDEAVHGAVFHSDGRRSYVEVEVKEVARLAEVVERANATVKKMQPNVSQVKFLDTSDEKLDKLYDGLHFAIFEATNNGNFVELNERFMAVATEADLTHYRLEVDNTAIYVQLHRAGAYLYRVVPLEVRTK